LALYGATWGGGETKTKGRGHHVRKRGVCAAVRARKRKNEGPKG